jgi:hypothetical protein
VLVLVDLHLLVVASTGVQSEAAFHRLPPGWALLLPRKKSQVVRPGALPCRLNVVLRSLFVRFESARGPPRVLARKVRRKLTTNAFEGSVYLLLRRDPESFSAAGCKLEAR